MLQKTIWSGVIVLLLVMIVLGTQDIHTGVGRSHKITINHGVLHEWLYIPKEIEQMETQEQRNPSEINYICITKVYPCIFLRMAHSQNSSSIYPRYNVVSMKKKIKPKRAFPSCFAHKLINFALTFIKCPSPKKLSGSTYFFTF